VSAIVLVVDDDPAIHRLLGRMLRLHGFRAEHAGTLSQAISVAEGHAITAVIVDLRLREGQSGLDVVRWFRARPPYAAIPILVLTGALELTEDERSAIEHHRAEVFFKPQRLHLLLDRLKTIVDSRRS
jgi:DNA-binding response OmpR family regulator